MRVLWISLAVLIVDQITKVIVKLTMYKGESIPILGDWFKLTFTENPGMAFGATFGDGPAAKIFLTVFSLVATLAIIGYLWAVRRAHWGYRMSLALIIGGALGNVIDRMFYGVLWGYGNLLFGLVVDFIHFDIWRGAITWPWASDPTYVTLFPIWNVADMAIVVGVCAILLFQHKLQPPKATEPGDEDAEAVLVDPTSPETRSQSGRPEGLPAGGVEEE